MTFIYSYLSTNFQMIYILLIMIYFIYLIFQFHLNINFFKFINLSIIILVSNFKNIIFIHYFMIKINNLLTIVSLIY